MRMTIVCVALALAGCGHAREAEVVSAYEPRATIGQSFTADTTRVQPPGTSSPEAGVKALVELLGTHLAAVGQPRPEQRTAEHHRGRI